MKNLIAMMFVFSVVACGPRTENVSCSYNKDHVAECSEEYSCEVDTDCLEEERCLYLSRKDLTEDKRHCIFTEDGWYIYFVPLD